MQVKRTGTSLTVDIHGMRVEQARFRLESLAASCSGDVTGIVVIHGCNSGDALKNLVRNELSGPRIRCVEPGANDGQSIIRLSKK